MYPGPIGGDLLARRYRLIDRVGAGGMSVVWRARDELLDRLVAVKWLGSDLGGDAVFRDLVRREAWATARIKHRAIAAVYDYGEVTTRDGQIRAYVVMEILDGEPLAALMRVGPMPWREAVRISGEVADALAAAHAHGVVHRDINPENVMLTTSGLRVFDFGIAAQIGEPDDDANGSTFGTPTYVAPERLDGLPAQTATDVYALGVMLYECMTGLSPFPEDAWDAMAARTPRVAPRPRNVPGLPGVVARLCQRCLEHNPDLRPTAREVADKLAQYNRPRWRSPIVVGTAAAVAAIAVATALTLPLLSSTPGAGDPGRLPGALGNLPSGSQHPTGTPTDTPSPGGSASAISSPATGQPGTPTPGGTPTTGATPPPVTTTNPTNTLSKDQLIAAAISQFHNVLIIGKNSYESYVNGATPPACPATYPTDFVRPDVFTDLNNRIGIFQGWLVTHPGADAASSRQELTSDVTPGLTSRPRECFDGLGLTARTNVQNALANISTALG